EELLKGLQQTFDTSLTNETNAREKLQEQYKQQEELLKGLQQTLTNETNARKKLQEQFDSEMLNIKARDILRQEALKK
ncbi:MAG: hypothetical protein Q4Q06_08030, partial [Bacteroidota bacterium]|nr:hypothetical protein [Bacteroidota bacterium]